MHAASLIRIRPIAYHKYSQLQLAYGKESNISHLRIFRCAIYVPIARSQRTKMDPQRRLGMHFGYDSLLIIRYLKPLMGNVFTAQFVDCHFNETNFPTLEGGIKLEKEIKWNASLVSFRSPYRPM